MKIIHFYEWKSNRQPSDLQSKSRSLYTNQFFNIGIIIIQLDNILHQIKEKIIEEIQNSQLCAKSNTLPTTTLAFVK